MSCHLSTCCRCSTYCQSSWSSTCPDSVTCSAWSICRPTLTPVADDLRQSLKKIHDEFVRYYSSTKCSSKTWLPEHLDQMPHQETVRGSAARNLPDPEPSPGRFDSRSNPRHPRSSVQPYRCT